MLTVWMLGVVIVIGGVGVFFVSRASRIGARYRDFAAHSVLTTGEVVDMAERWNQNFAPQVGQGSDGTPTYYHPVVRFDVGGRSIETETMYGARPAPAKVGQTVQIRYDPANPQRAALASGRGSGSAVGPGLTVLGVLMLVFAGFVFLFWVLLKLVLKVPA